MIKNSSLEISKTLSSNQINNHMLNKLEDWIFSSYGHTQNSHNIEKMIDQSSFEKIGKMFKTGCYTHKDCAELLQQHAEATWVPTKSLDKSENVTQLSPQEVKSLANYMQNLEYDASDELSQFQIRVVN